MSVTFRKHKNAGNFRINKRAGNLRIFKFINHDHAGHFRLKFPSEAQTCLNFVGFGAAS